MQDSSFAWPFYLKAWCLQPCCSKLWRYVNSPCVFPFSWKKSAYLFWHLLKRCNSKEEESSLINLSTVHSQMPPTARQARLKSGAQSSIWISPMSCTGPSSWAVLCCLRGCISRQLGWKQSRWNLNRHSKREAGILSHGPLCCVPRPTP